MKVVDNITLDPDVTELLEAFWVAVGFKYPGMAGVTVIIELRPWVGVGVGGGYTAG